jgi:hypothetical protein
MTDATLTKTQKNHTLRYIAESGFDPVDFAWSDVIFVEHSSIGSRTTYTVSRLQHRATN